MDKKLKDKLRKLEAMINDPAATEGEVNNATVAMNRLLLKHNLDMSTLDLSHHDVMQEETLTDGNKNEGPWEGRLLKTIADYNLGMVYKTKDFRHSSSGILTILGTEENVEAIKEQFFILRIKFRAMAKDRTKEAKQEAFGKFNPNKWKRDYLLGAVSGLRDKFESQKSELGTESGEYGLMVRKHTDVIESYLENQGTHLSTSKGRRRKLSGGYSQGQMDGNRTTTQRALN